MSDIWKIWKIEFRKQRWEWIVSLVSLVILGILLFFLNNTQPEMWLFAVLCGFSVMLLMTGRVITSDSQQNMTPLVFAFPVTPGRLFLAKYTYSLFFPSLYLLTILFFPFAEWKQFTPILVTGFFLLHTCMWFCGIILENIFGLVTGIGAVPVLLAALIPVFGVIASYRTSYADGRDSDRNEILLIALVLLCAGLFNLYAVFRLWVRVAAHGRRVSRFLFRYLIAWIILPLAVWMGFQIVWIIRYRSETMKIQQQYPKVQVPVEIPESFLQFEKIKQERGEKEAVRNLIENKKTVSRPETDFYRKSLWKAFEAICREQTDALEAKDYERLYALSDALLRMPLYNSLFCLYFTDLLQNLPPEKASIPFLEKMYTLFRRESVRQFYPSNSFYALTQNRSWINLLRRSFQTPRFRSSSDTFPAIFRIAAIAEYNGLSSYRWSIKAEREVNEIRTPKKLARFASKNSWRFAGFDLYYTLPIAYKTQALILSTGKPSDSLRLFLTQEEINLFAKYPMKYSYQDSMWTNIGNLAIGNYNLAYPMSFVQKDGKYIHKKAKFFLYRRNTEMNKEPSGSSAEPEQRGVDTK